MDEGNSSVKVLRLQLDLHLNCQEGRNHLHSLLTKTISGIYCIKLVLPFFHSKCQHCVYRNTRFMLLMNCVDMMVFLSCLTTQTAFHYISALTHAHSYSLAITMKGTVLISSNVFYIGTNSRLSVLPALTY